jgi:cytochrome c-type biogenesis protein CcmH/NrfG
MGKALLKQGRNAEAISKFREALQLDPKDFQTLAFLARVLASDENPQIRNGVEAVALAEKANDLTGGEHPFILDILAMSYAETGHFKDALQAEQHAIQLAQAADLKETNEMNARLELYKSGQPYRETFTNALPQNPPKN